MTRKSHEHLRMTYANTGQLFRPYEVSFSSVYRNLHHWRSNQRPQIAVPKPCNWATCSYRTQVTPNQLVTVIGRAIVEFRHCNMWSLVRSTVVEITVYTAEWDLIRSKQMSSVRVRHAYVFGGFSGRGNSIQNNNFST